MVEQSSAIELLAARLQQISEQLNALRTVTEPVPTSRVPVIGPLLNLLRRAANRLAVRWYVAPQVEQQARFAQEVVASFDELATALMEQANLAEVRQQKLQADLAHMRQRVEVLELVGMGGLLPPPAASPSEWERLAALSSAELRAVEDADLLPPREEAGLQTEYALWYGYEDALAFPLLPYDQAAGWHYLFNLAVVGQALDCRPGDLVLDLAGGSGWVSEFLSRFGMRTVLLDVMEDLLHTSRARFGMDRRLGRCAVSCPVVGDALWLPFADGALDGVICMNALHHMPSYETALQEIYRVLKPGGRAVFGEPGEGHARSPLSQWAMREYGVLEKNLPLSLIYVYARRAGFARMWQYLYPYPEALESPYPEEAASPDTALRRIAQVLPDWLRNLSLFALEKAGRQPPTSDLRPSEQVGCRLLADITLLEHHDQVLQNGSLQVRVRVRNAGDVVWLAADRPGGGFVRLGVKLCAEGGRLLRDDLERVNLPFDIAPGEQVDLEIKIQAPALAGRYSLKYDMVDERRTWFELFGSIAVEHPLQVLPAEHAVGG